MNKMARQLLPFGTLMLIVCILSVLKPDTFLTMDNILKVLSRSSINGIVAVGMTAVIISAGIDLSVGSMLALSGMVGALAMIWSGELFLRLGAAIDSESLWRFLIPVLENPGTAFVFGSIVMILTGVACGLFNGTLITKLKLPPFIVTLGTMSIFRGISVVMTGGKAYNVPDYTFLDRATLGGIPVCVFIFAFVVAAAGVVLRYTRLGRYTYAIGSNREAAFHSGVNVDFNLILIYTLTGLAVGTAAMIETSRSVSAQPTAGIAMELDIIAAVVIGGASLSGGRGTITGTIVGTLLISFLRNGCALVGVSTDVQRIVIGAIIIAAVSLDQFARSKAASSSSA